MEQPIAPPTSPGTISAHRQTVWPVSLGVASIVFGVIGCAYTGVSLISTVFMNQMFSAVQSEAAAMIEVQKKWALPMSAVNAALFLAAVLLLIGGILLLQRLMLARTLLIVWCIVKIFLSTTMMGITILMQLDQMDAIAASDPNAAPGMQMASGFVVGSSGLMLLWFLVLPVFTLIWLNRRSIVEEVRTWRRTGRRLADGGQA